MADRFRATVEHLASGDRQVMEVSAGDYILIPFEPCHRVSVDADLQRNRHTIVIDGYRPTALPRRIRVDNHE